jgi:hypothetical protein
METQSSLIPATATVANMSKEELFDAAKRRLLLLTATAKSLKHPSEIKQERLDELPLYWVVYKSFQHIKGMSREEIVFLRDLHTLQVGGDGSITREWLLTLHRTLDGVNPRGLQWTR